MTAAVAVVGWIVAIVFGSITYRNYRRSHFPCLSCAVNGYSAIGHPMDKMHPRGEAEHFLQVTLFCEGIDLYGLSVSLECVYFMPDDKTPHRARFLFDPLETDYADPFKKGQCRLYCVNRQKLAKYRHNGRKELERLYLMDLREGSVSIRIYRKGDDHPVAIIPAGDFIGHLRRFDRPSRVTVTFTEPKDGAGYFVFDDIKILPKTV